MEKLNGVLRRHLLLAAAIALMGAAGLSAAQAPATEFQAPRWVATWSSPPMPHGSQIGPDGSRSFDNQTVRQIVHISAGGTRLRVQISNEYGTGALIVGAARIAMQSSGASVVPVTNRELRFGGSPSVVIQPGAVALSDPVNLSVPSNSSLAISLWVPQNTGFATYHHNSTQTTYISGPGDFSAAVHFPFEETTTSRYWLTFVEVLPHKRIDALAVIGDSISEGFTTTPDANRTVTDVLSRRLNPPVGPARLAVLNQGTGCGRLLRDTCGPSGLSRFEREVLNAAGVAKVVIELGYADIILPTAMGWPDEIVSAGQIITGLRQLIHRARARGLKVIGATMTPNEGTEFPNVHTPENEAKRLAVNHWIRTSGAFDAVADYDLAVRDPRNPARLLAKYADPDLIHLNDAGHEAIAHAILLSLR